MALLIVFVVVLASVMVYVEGLRSQSIATALTQTGYSYPLGCLRGNGNPRNVVLLIGDGMGYSHIYATQLVYRYLNMSILFNTTGIAINYAKDNIVPDSAGAGTAIATGFITLNRMISMVEIEGREVPVMSILELAKRLGMSTGLVTTTRVTHATPAVFASHVPHRDMEDKIAVQIIENEVDVILGGGARFFTKDLLNQAKQKGYTVVFNRSMLLEVDPKLTKKLLGLFADSHIPYVLDRGVGTPGLLEMTMKAISILERNPCGFFLMIEGGRIDHAAHSNDIASVVAETKEFDDVVGYVMLYARNRGDTLVIVTADHETGGLTIGLSTEIPTNISLVRTVKVSAEKIAGEIRRVNTTDQVKEVIYKYTNVIISDEEARSILALRSASEIGKIVSKHFSVLWASTSHTASPVPVFAYGPGSKLFSGMYNHQTYIPKAITRLLLLGVDTHTVHIGTRPPIRGDINSNGISDIGDIIIAIMYFLGKEADDSSKVIDLNFNGVIDIEDIYILYKELYLGK